MSEKIELIPAAELPVAESDDVEALVIEGGELKRKEAGGEVRSVNGIKPDEHGNVEVGGSGDGPGLVHVKFFIDGDELTTDTTITCDHTHEQIMNFVRNSECIVYATLHDSNGNKIVSPRDGNWYIYSTTGYSDYGDYYSGIIFGTMDHPREEYHTYCAIFMEDYDNIWPLRPGIIC